MSNNYGPKIATNGLILHLDAADTNSYPLSGSTIYDLSGNNNGTQMELLIFQSPWLSAKSITNHNQNHHRHHNHQFAPSHLKSWYSITYGSNYVTDWKGFNFPSRVLEPFRQGLFDPLTKEENNLLNLLKYRHDNFYIIGAQDEATLKHELTHALYATNLKYKSEIDNVLDKNRKKISKAYSHLLKMGYTKEVIYDEIQAYTIDGDANFIWEYLDLNTIRKIQEIYQRYR